MEEFTLRIENIKFVRNRHTIANVLDKELSSHLKHLSDMEKKSVLLMIKTFLRSRSEESTRISTEDYNREIDEALAEVAAGDYITQEEMEKLASKW